MYFLEDSATFAEGFALEISFDMREAKSMITVGDLDNLLGKIQGAAFVMLAPGELRSESRGAQ